MKFVKFRKKRHYHGEMCTKCDSTTKYKSDDACVRCMQLRNVKFRNSQPDYMKEVCAIWTEANQDHIKQYRLDNPELGKAATALRRANLIQATPSWFNSSLVTEIYAKSARWIYLTHVDHIYPLTCDWVCGFHVHDNLIPIAVKDNLSKGNRRYDGYHGVIGTLLEEPIHWSDL